MIFWGNPAPPATYPNATYPAPDYGNSGDIYIRNTTKEQFRWNGSAWDSLSPDETRGDVVYDEAVGALGAGQVNDRVSKIANRPYAVGWRNAADGVVFTANKAVGDAEDEWTINHQLSNRLIDVTVFTPGNEDITQNIERTVIFPEVIIVNPNQCRLKFVEPVSGTALIRR